MCQIVVQLPNCIPIVFIIILALVSMHLVKIELKVTALMAVNLILFQTQKLNNFLF